MQSHQAELRRPCPHVRLWHNSDVPLALTNVCFEGKNGHDSNGPLWRLMTQADISSGHGPLENGSDDANSRRLARCRDNPNRDKFRSPRGNVPRGHPCTNRCP